MSYFIDVKYLEQIGHRLPLFVKKKADLWNCRCVICGDSQKNKRRTRGFFYRQRSDLYYKCHNCDISQHFGTFLKNFDSFLYQQYVFERYSKGENGPKAHKNLEDVFEMTFEAPKPKPPEERKLAEISQALNTLPDDHPAVVYCTKRKIPLDRLKDIRYIAHSADIVQIAPQYEGIIESKEPRILFPFYYKGSLVGATMRDIGRSSLRYVMAKFSDEAPSIFNYDAVDTSKRFYVVEGPIDSLFLPNAMACNGTSFGKLEYMDIPKENAVIVFDNQPRNEQVCKIMEKYVNLGYNVCLWPQNVHEKDINDMVLAGHNVQRIIDDNVSSGLLAKLNFTKWRKC